jgi:hypothetical protein
MSYNKWEGEFSVCQFFEDGTYEYVRRYVEAKEAVKAFQHYTTNVAVKMGIVKRVIITDGGDCISMEWQYGKGITFPLSKDIKSEKDEEI